MRTIKSKGAALLLAALSVTIIGCSSDSGTAAPAPTPTTENWAGSWTNTNAMSTGPLSAVFVDNGDGTITVTIDLDGFVGGMFNPDAQTITATEQANGDTTFSGMVDMMGMQGQLDFTLTDAGALTISLPNIPLAGFDSFTASGTVTDTTTNLNYTVNFTVGAPAAGTATATKS